MNVIYTNAAGATGRVYFEGGEAVTHCASEDGFERWLTCDTCGGVEVYCFNCGSTDRELSTCTCEHRRTH